MMLRGLASLGLSLLLVLLSSHPAPRPNAARPRPDSHAHPAAWAALRNTQSTPRVTVHASGTAPPPWIAEGNQEYAFFGLPAGTAGDVNGDGYDDLIVGAGTYDGGQHNEGRVFVYHGGPGGLGAGPDWTAEGNQEEALFGGSAGTAGDVNGDGYDDVLIGAYRYDNGQEDEGRAFVYLGSPSGLSATPGWTAESDQKQANLGYAVGAAGDVNGDGFADIIVGAYRYDGDLPGEGRAYVYLGGPGGLSDSPAWVAEGDQPAARFGISVGPAGDVNSDGYDDVIVGADLHDGGQQDEGRAYVYHGSRDGLSPAPVWSAEGDQAEAYFGHAVAAAGDVNGDGYSDVIVGAYRYDGPMEDEGRVSVYYGGASGLSTSPAWSAQGSQSSARFGISVGAAGDVDGDGFGDAIVGADWHHNGKRRMGAAFLFHGAAAGLSATPAWVTEADREDSYLGRSVGTAGDLNADGYDDFVVAAPWYDSPEKNEGRVYVYYFSAFEPSSYVYLPLILGKP